MEIDSPDGWSKYGDSENTDFRILNGLFVSLPSYVAILGVVFFFFYVIVRGYRRKVRNAYNRVDRQIKKF